MNWQTTRPNMLLLAIIIASLQITIPQVHCAAAAVADKEVVVANLSEEELAKYQLNDAEIDAIVRECDALENDPDLNPEALEELCKEFDDPGFLHSIMHQREVWLEKVEKFNETPVIVLDQLGTVQNIDPSNHKVFLNFTNLFNGLNNDNAQADEIVHVERLDRVHLGILVKDLLKPAFYCGSLLLDIDCMGGYFDSIIEIIANAIVQKEETVRYNLDIMLETNNTETFSTTFQNLDEALQKVMDHENRMRRLAIKFFKKRILPACIQHAQKTLRSAPFIFSRAPRDKNKAKEDEGKIPVMSFSDHWPVRLILQPIVTAMSEPFELKLNEYISGYRDKRPFPFARMSGAAVASFFGNALPKFAQVGLDTIHEGTKQFGFTSDIDETLWFTLSSELLFNLYFFHRTLDVTIKDQLLEMLIKESIVLKDTIEAFERQLANPRNAGQEKQLEIKQAFKEEIHTVVMRHFSPLQPVLLEKLRKNHATFQTLTTMALLAPCAIKLIWPFIRTTN